MSAFLILRPVYADGRKLWAEMLRLDACVMTNDVPNGLLWYIDAHGHALRMHVATPGARDQEFGTVMIKVK